MRFKRFISHGFGCLPDGFTCEFPEQGLIILAGDNEAGKSTLVEGLLAGLYGIEETPKKAAAFRKRYSPWFQTDQSPSFTLEITTADGTPLELFWDFGNENRKKAALKVTHALTREDCTRQFVKDRNTYAVGERLTGLSRSSFIKSALVQQNSLQRFEVEYNDKDEVQARKELRQTIERVVISSRQQSTAQEAMERLAQAERDHISPITRTKKTLANVIKDLENKIAQLEADQSRLLEDYRPYQEEFKQRDTLKAQLAQCRAELEQARQRERLARFLEAKHLLEEDNQHRLMLDQLKEQMNELESAKTFPKELKADVEHARIALEHEQMRLKPLMEAAEKLENTQLLIRQQLEGCPWSATCLARDTILNLSEPRLRDCMSRLKTAEDHYHQEIKRLESQGIDCQRFLSLLKKFSDLPQDTLPGLLKLYRDRCAAEAAYDQVHTQLDPLRPQRDSLTKDCRVKSLWAWSTLICGLLLVGLFFLPVQLSWGLTLLPGLLLILIALKLFWTANQVKAQRNNIADQIAKLEDQREKLRVELDTLKSAWHQHVAPIEEQFPWALEVEHLPDLLWFIEKQEAACHTLIENQKTLNLRESDLQEILQELASQLEQDWNESIPLQEQRRRTEDWLRDYRHFKALYDNLKDIEQQKNEKQSQIQEVHTAIAGHEQTLKQLFESCGFESYGSIGEGLQWFFEAFDNREKWDILCAEYARLNQLLLDPQKRSSYETQFHTHQDVSHLPVPEDIGPSVAESQQVEVLRNREDQLQEQLTQVERLYEKQNDFHTKYHAIQQDLETYRLWLDKYTQYQRALHHAQTILESVSQQEYISWSGRLNQTVNRHLQQFNVPYHNLHFRPDLTFTIEDTDGRVYTLADNLEYLSRGARDQLYLAVRFAIADCLSQSCTHLPMILDDPFVNLDDKRFFQTMRALTGIVSTGRQVLVVSCHLQRHQQLVSSLQPTDNLLVTLCPFTPSEKFHQKVVLVGPESGIK